MPYAFFFAKGKPTLLCMPEIIHKYEQIFNAQLVVYALCPLTEAHTGRSALVVSNFNMPFLRAVLSEKRRSINVRPITLVNKI
jgi:hypothetical protein